MLLSPLRLMNPSKIWMQENHFGDIGVVKMILVEFLEILVHKCSTSPHSDFWHYIACLALSSLQKPCRHFIWTQLFSPLAPSVMTFLFQPEQRRHSPFLHCRLKTHLIKRDVMSPTQLPFCRIFPLYFRLKTIYLLCFLFLNLAYLSHTITESHAVAWAAWFRCSLSSLCLSPLFWFCNNIGHKLRHIFPSLLLSVTKGTLAGNNSESHPAFSLA